MRRNTTFKQIILRFYTLIELMIVLSVIAILVSLLIPVLKTAAADTERIGCSENFRGIGNLFSSYASENNCHLPMEFVHEGGNYWSNILYSSYYSESGLERVGTWEPPSYVDNIGYFWNGNEHEEGTIFHCPSAKKFERLNTNFVGAYPLSYTMNTVLSGIRSDKTAPVNINRIANPSEGFISMDFNYNIFIEGWSFWGYSTKTMSTFYHKSGRNILYVDGHVSYTDNQDIPSNNGSDRRTFWYGMY